MSETGWSLAATNNEPTDTWITHCHKCGVHIGLATMPRSMVATYRPLCQWCERIKAWLPDIVEAVVKALGEAQPVSNTPPEDQSR